MNADISQKAVTEVEEIFEESTNSMSHDSLSI